MIRNARSLSALLLVAAGSFLSLGSSLLAVDAQRVAEREIARREAAVPRGAEALARAKVAMQARDYARAHEEYRVAVAYLPDGVANGKAHDDAVRGFAESGVKLAEIRVQEGKFNEAEAICQEILSSQYDPNYRPAQRLLASLKERGQINRTMGPKFIGKVEEVRKLLIDAEGYYNSGRYDLAFKKYEQILNIDPYNTAARRGQERINLEKTRYGEEAYNETRSRSLWEVQKGWERPVRQYGPATAAGGDTAAREATGTARISHKLNTIIIPRIEFRDASIREAIDYLRQQAAANDPAPEGRKGVDIVLRLNAIGGRGGPAAPPVTPAAADPLAPIPADAGAVTQPAPIAVPAAPTVSPQDARITITLNQIPLGEALRYIASQAGLKVKVEPYAVSIIPLSEQSQELITKEYRVPPGFIQTTLNPNAGALTAPTAPTGRGGTAKDTVEATGGQQLVRREGAKEYLESQGVPFSTVPGSSANFLPQTSRLIVRNTPDNLELVDAIVEQANVAGPKQVEIEAKFVEITQNNLKELGFDWLLGQFNIGSERVFGGGGTTGLQAGPGVAPGSPNFPFAPPGGAPVGQFPVTGGNRSGMTAISGNEIDTLLFGANAASAVAPGIFSLSGVFTDPQFQVVIRALNQKKGVDLLSAPRVTTKSGQRATIEIVREFRYPTQFEPPQIPQMFGGGISTTTVTTGQTSASGAFPVTPTTPTAFETRNTGVTLEVEPVIGPDGVTIDLNLVPQVVEFEGFINYGSPIRTFSTNLLGMSQSQEITPNIINQPIFSSRKVTTSVSVWDGQTVVLGGLMREDVQKVEDKTPIIGDIPIVGRLFRSNAEQHLKRNLVIFVTARLINPGGQLVNQIDEEEEADDVVEPPILPELPMYKK
ncbi:MAG TPA: Amuc_1098 family type IV pilus outer membrane protein [Chthoniobacterales bacterium]|nr:Amuc_1098 family type IV pilus outer membrane protein [Chthoniobacterales bacterium]